MGHIGFIGNYATTLYCNLLFSIHSEILSPFSPVNIGSKQNHVIRAIVVFHYFLLSCCIQTPNLRFLHNSGHYFESADNHL